MERRHFLAGPLVGGLTTAAGCLGGDGDDPEDDDEPRFEFESVSTAISTDREYDGHRIPYIAVEDAYEVWEADEARFVDTRSVSAFAHQHIEGAVASPAPDGLEENDPLEAIPADEPVIVYCPCPYSLSEMRGASLLDDGYETVAGLDEGFPAWIDAGYPTASSDEDDQTATVTGSVDAEHEGTLVSVSAVDSDRAAFGYVGPDGHYEVGLGGLGDTERIVLETPTYTLEGSVPDLTSGPIAG